jgi:hypothetical protein
MQRVAFHVLCILSSSVFCGIEHGTKTRVRVACAKKGKKALLKTDINDADITIQENKIFIYELKKK